MNCFVQCLKKKCQCSLNPACWVIIYFLVSLFCCDSKWKIFGFCIRQQIWGGRLIFHQFQVFYRCTTTNQTPKFHRVQLCCFPAVMQLPEMMTATIIWASQQYQARSGSRCGIKPCGGRNKTVLRTWDHREVTGIKAQVCSRTDCRRLLADDWLLICVANSFNQQLITRNNNLLFRNNVLDKALSASGWQFGVSLQEICKNQCQDVLHWF